MAAFYNQVGSENILKREKINAENTEVTKIKKVIGSQVNVGHNLQLTYAPRYMQPFFFFCPSDGLLCFLPFSFKVI